MLKLVLQPIVENAIYHGIKGRRRSGKIRIEAKVTDRKLYLTVQDDGAGMSSERLHEMARLLGTPLESMETQEAGQGGKSYGMLNVQGTPSAFFGEEYGISLNSREGEGTCVTITQPLMKELHKRCNSILKKAG